ncbi:hypothetical protein FI667_g9423, partial [Globisporangium splendens]
MKLNAIILKTTLASACTAALATSLGTASAMTRDANMVTLQFDNAPNTLTDGQLTTAVVRLNQAYYDNPPAEVEISAPGIKFGRSKFAFQRDHYDTFVQRVTCRTDGGSADGTTFSRYAHPGVATHSDSSSTACLSVNSSGNSSSSGHQNPNTASQAPCGQLWQVLRMGRPHLATLDGVAYDFQTAGVFRLLQSRNFQVQVFQEKCTPVASLGDKAPSCYQDVAMAIGASVARFRITGSKVVVGKASSSLQWLSVEKLDGQTDGYRVFVAADESTYVDITLATWINNYPYLNVALQVSPYFKDASVTGLMGNWNGNRNDNLTDNAKLAVLYGVSLTDNLFTCAGDACSKFLQFGSLQDSMALALPDTVPLLHQGYAVLPSTSVELKTFETELKKSVVAGSPKRQLLRHLDDNDNDEAGNVSAAAVDVFPERAAEPRSQTITSIPICSKYIANSNFFVCNVCYEDAVLLRDLSVVDNTKVSYLRECRRELDARLAANMSSAAETNVLQRDRVALLFGNLSRCASDCSGRGTCLAAGCKYDLGFTGFVCELVI